MQIAARTGAWAKSGYTAKDYVQDGLIAMWDGIENAGFGVHDPNATVWKDLSGRNNDATIVKGFFNANCFSSEIISNDAVCGCYCENSDLIAASVSKLLTIELVYEKYGKYENRRGLFGFTNKEGANFIIVPSVYFVGDYTNWFCYGGSYRIIDTTDNLLTIKSRSYTGNGNICRVYKNGVFSSQSSGSSNHDTSTGLYLNGIGTQGGSAGVLYYSVRVYSKALSDAEIAANYAVDKVRFNLT